MTNDNYPTDEWLLSLFSGWDDPCPLNPNFETDGLTRIWADRTFVNPPYSDPLPWIEKAVSEARGGKIVVLLLKMDTSTKWFARLKEANAEFLWINGRLHYNGLHHTYKGNVPFPFPSMFAILNPKGDDLT